MKKIIASLLLLSFFAQYSSAQTGPIRPKSIGFSFFGNDFATAQAIRSTSLAAVLRDNKVSKFKEMSHGFALSYFQGFTSHVDFAGTLGGSFVRMDLPGKTATSDNFLLEADASGNFKMLAEGATLNPYLIAGIGGSVYKNIYGAFIPLGGGLKINLFDEAQIFTQLQYRIPVTTNANNYHFQVSFGISSSL